MDACILRSVTQPLTSLLDRILGGWLPPVFVAIDFETANSRATSACAVGLVRVERGFVQSPVSFLIQPPPGPFTFSWIHGIKRHHVRFAGVFRSVWEKLSPLLDGAAFVAAHNSDFDRRVLASSCKLAGLAIPTVEFLCTMRLAQLLWGPGPSNLPAICDRIGFPLRHHEASSDANAAAEIVLTANRLSQGAHV